MISKKKISQTVESMRRGALFIQEEKKLEPKLVHILDDDESEEPEPPLIRRKRNHTEKDKRSSSTVHMQLDETAPETNELCQLSLGTVGDLKGDRSVIGDTNSNGKASVFENGTPVVSQTLDLHQNSYHQELQYESPFAKKSVADQYLTNGKSSNNLQTHAHVDVCNGKDVGNSSVESEKKMEGSNQSKQSPNSCIGLPKYTVFIEDITRGEESNPISLVSDSGSSSLKLPKFFYISRNIIFKNAYVNFSLARISDHNWCSNCSGDCLLSPANCACTGETRGDFAYTSEGVVEEKFLDECIGMSQRKPKKYNLYYCENCPLENTSVTNGKHQKRKNPKGACKGHLMRKFIKECWAKCGCSRNCGNRVVQRGIKVKLQVFQTAQGKGWGLRTLEDMEKGTFVCEYVGEIVTNQELHERNEESWGEEHTYPVLLDADWASERHLKDEEALCLDATKFGNVARFINHRCNDANLVEIPVEVETPDHHYYHIAFFTSRKIKANEELTWDYGIDFDDETHPIKAFDCKCGSFFCCMKNRSSP
ncbi:hypothetical protein Patl1_35914 [Pistacia atlantica]|nr:hypothetical protein Patl1_35914 [Pistacia atlantica]